MEEIEAELKREEGANKNKQMKGWGRWAGPGIN
jgi:U3 small nucleolar RNA-associated protein 14